MMGLKSLCRTIAALMLVATMVMIGARGSAFAQEGATPVASSNDTATSSNDTTASSSDTTASSNDTVAPVASDVAMTVAFYDCATDPLDVAPADSPNCTAAEGVVAEISVDGTDAGVVASNASGVADVSAPDGANVTITEDEATIAAGYSPYGSGVVSFTAASGLSFTFVHLPSAELGRVQIVSATCPTSGEPGTTFRVIEPGPRIAAAVSCQPTPSIAFTIRGGGLGDGFVATTDADGVWRGYLPAGDYTIASADDVTANFTVYNDDIVAIVAIDYVSQPTGSLTISRWQCSPDEDAPVTIEVAPQAPSAPDSCTASNGKVSIAEVGSSADPAEITLGEGGSVALELKPGSYEITDLTSGQTGAFELTTDQPIYVTISGGPAKVSTAGDGSAGNSASSGDGSEAGNGSSAGTGASNQSGSTDGNGADTDGNDTSASGSGAVTTLPDTGVHQTRNGKSLPLDGAVALSLFVLAVAFLQRRNKIEQ